MDEQQLHIPLEQKKRSLKQYILEKKMGIAGFSFVLLCFVLFAVAFIFKFKLIAVVLLVALLGGIPFVLLVTLNLRVGITLFLIFSFILFDALRFIDLPLGVLMDFMVGLMFIGIFIDQAKEKDWKRMHNPISYMVGLWILYCFLEVLNPWAASKLAWVYTIRATALLMLIYFITLYAFTTKKFLKFFLSVWIGLALLAALYGLYQEFVGLSSLDIKWITEDKERFKLFYNWGRYRKFSFLGNPTIFGIAMSYSALLCFVLSFRKTAPYKKFLLVFAALLMAWSMIYSGTRTSIAMLPAGLFFFLILTFQKKPILLGCFLFVIGAIIIISPIQSLGPISKNNLERIRSTFSLSDDPSYEVRMKNQEYIQPFIRSHPMGGGLGSVGVWGARFSPNSPLSKFPPDSGYVRVAVEMGWMGLLLYCSLLFITLYVGIKNYKEVQDPKIKNYYTALLTVFYSLIVANYPQQAVTMYPTMPIFFILMGLMIALKRLDKKYI